MFFTVPDDGDEDGFANVVFGAGKEADDMDQGQGRTELDDKRKVLKATYAESSTGGASAAPFPGEAAPSYMPFVPPRRSSQAAPEPAQMVIPVKVKEVQGINVQSLQEAKPAGLMSMKLRELQCDCDRWGVATSGTKQEVLDRLVTLHEARRDAPRGSSDSGRLT